MVRFVESDSTGLPLKRKQVAQACARCRRRKKRCFHNHDEHHAADALNLASGDGDVAAAGSPTDLPSHPSHPSPPSPPEAEPLPERPTSQNKQGQASRFIGDLSPEVVLMEATSLCSHRDVSVRGGLGIWQPRAPDSTKSASPFILTSPSRQAVQDMLKAYVWSHCIACCPPPSDYAVLRRIYLEKLDPIFPILGNHLTLPLQDEIEGKVLQQIVSLAAAADPEASRHLRLNVEGPLLSRHDFCDSLSNSIQTIIDAGLITDRVFLVRILAALSLYMQPSSPDEADVPALLSSRAVHQIHTLGLQMVSVDSQTSNKTRRSLFCCTWALDRINSAFYGRACLIHERDIGLNMDACIAEQAPPFRLFLMLIGLLENVIALYRPGNQREDEVIVELPIFEQMILDAGAARVSSSCLASLEIFYHSIAILSSQSPSENRSTALPAPATNSRRSLAADRITSIVGHEFLGQLSYLPIIPYGVSLSLSVSYRKMRHSNVPMFRNRGKQAFMANTFLLKSLDDTFWTAKAMVAMAEQVLREMDKAVASITQETGLGDASKKAESTSRGDQEIASSGPGDSIIDYTIQGNTDISILETIPDLDVFGHFDPTFNLGAVDAILEGNLDFGPSSNLFEWQQLRG
ncbi:uncharacterized protein GGS22DRAFT_179004 [Annulohypoxylon maeteangense]|uniref:uncharacterized protein n=1 Tax=Annulohypoxylon maeteangense TaxID=1927788 RepID=UPI0020089057|nr:uncharacterized protein GGS22DRAFT_179004 [Annulohypoxylon maeteangense]KAI0887071.1 hypothetical protein GGS22DRAFT_179004 [Annulohypoxylon maeteangense]